MLTPKSNGMLAAASYMLNPKSNGMLQAASCMESMLKHCHSNI
jgi:hypothetical protein